MDDPYSIERMAARPRVVKHLVEMAGLLHLASEAPEYRQHHEDLAAAAQHVRDAVDRLQRWGEDR